MADGPLIVGLGGSTGPASVTNVLLRSCLDHAAARGARTAMFGGDELSVLPIYDGASDDAAAFVDAVRRADAVVIATPGYHGGMSGLVQKLLLGPRLQILALKI